MRYNSGWGCSSECNCNARVAKLSKMDKQKFGLCCVRVYLQNTTHIDLLIMEFGNADTCRGFVPNGARHCTIAGECVCTLFLTCNLWQQ